MSKICFSICICTSIVDRRRAVSVCRLLACIISLFSLLSFAMFFSLSPSLVLFPARTFLESSRRLSVILLLLLALSPIVQQHRHTHTHAFTRQNNIEMTLFPFVSIDARLYTDLVLWAYTLACMLVLLHIIQICAYVRTLWCCMVSFCVCLLWRKKIYIWGKRTCDCVVAHTISQLWVNNSTITTFQTIVIWKHAVATFLSLEVCCR